MAILKKLRLMFVSLFGKKVSEELKKEDVKVVDEISESKVKVNEEYKADKPSIEVSGELVQLLQPVEQEPTLIITPKFDLVSIENKIDALENELKDKYKTLRAELESYEAEIHNKSEKLKLREEKLKLAEEDLVKRARKLKLEKTPEGEYIDPEVQKLLKIIDELLGHLPENIINQFVQSENYKFYKKVMEKYKIG